MDGVARTLGAGRFDDPKHSTSSAGVTVLGALDRNIGFVFSGAVLRRFRPRSD